MQDYDVVIIGGGPAGLSAGLYSSRALLKTLIVESGAVGGQVTTTSDMENYPGSISDNAMDLANRMKEQALHFGTEIVTGRCKSVKKVDSYFHIVTDKEEYKAKAVIIATGSQPRNIGCKGEQEFRGLGVSYCATCDANFFRGLHVVVVGGGDSAIDEGLYLTKFADKVTVVHRRDTLRAAKSLQKKAFANVKMEFILDSVVEEIKGDGIVNAVVLRNVKTKELTELKADGVFGFVGYNPSSELFKDLVEVDGKGYIVSDENMKTTVPGIFVAGDVRKKMLKQVITATADGAVAAISAEKYITG
ncbi:thioredoxin reductase (NADPH) [Alkalibaculum bacchi]|uniref:Thioredoxin reductase n=1 Tax=Alkalibaculum bacchi TaxID=645887 RepID=A0A366IDG5_9FIRM|nr:thioredoxin-disulfide reductase [Alkalibaculum bacchi]RBP69034.1 thioredoxin reductase (NADPH) [Alkalibaculum bacchi]